MEINHAPQIVSFAHIDPNTKDLYTYYFQITKGKIWLHSIDKWEKNGRTGNGYKHEEVFHFEYKNTITNYETGEFEQPKVPEYLMNNAKLFFIGYVANNCI